MKNLWMEVKGQCVCFMPPSNKDEIETIDSVILKLESDGFSWHLNVIYYPPELLLTVSFVNIYSFVLTPVQTCLPGCDWIGFLLIRENKRFRLMKGICLVWGYSSDLEHAMLITTFRYFHRFLCSHLPLLVFRPLGQIQLDLIHLWLRFSICGFEDGPGTFRNGGMDGGLSKTNQPGIPLLCLGAVPRARPANSWSVGTTDHLHPYSIMSFFFSSASFFLERQREGETERLLPRRVL